MCGGHRIAMFKTAHGRPWLHTMVPTRCPTKDACHAEMQSGVILEEKQAMGDKPDQKAGGPGAMRDIFILTEREPYEGEEVLGAFATLDEAKAGAGSLSRKSRFATSWLRVWRMEIGGMVRHLEWEIRAPEDTRARYGAKD